MALQYTDGLWDYEISRELHESYSESYSRQERRWCTNCLPRTLGIWESPLVMDLGILQKPQYSLIARVTKTYLTQNNKQLTYLRAETVYEINKKVYQ